jgi:diamine N-acetyltransferase
MSPLKTVEVLDSALVEKVAMLADEIWTEYYTPIIGREQVRYMFDKFQSADSIARQIAEERYRYYLLYQRDETPIGYMAAVDQPSEQALFLSKIYFKKETRGRGYGGESLRFLEGLARQNQRTKISLTVNKYNLSSIAAYEKMGFKKVRAVVADIGGGFFMDDYVLEKSVPADLYG